jgi:methionyl-tRNA formyltransferase
MKILLISKENEWSKLLSNLLRNELPDNIKRFDWYVTCDKNEIESLNPDWIFFFHWSDIVPKEIYTNFKCVVTHTSNLPDGRGGHPLQNQILAKVIESRLNLIHMTDEIDGGPVYATKSITLQGNLSDIWFMLATVASSLIVNVLITNPVPVPQLINKNLYKRRKNTEIDFGTYKDLNYIYDCIRMVDAEGYSNSYIELGDFKLEFSRAKYEGNNILADVRITKK